MLTIYKTQYTYILSNNYENLNIKLKEIKFLFCDLISFNFVYFYKLFNLL